MALIKLNYNKLSVLEKKMASKNSLIGMIIIIVLAVIAFFWMKNAYNNMVVTDEEVKTAWSQVENQYQRRLDLIPNLVNTVKGYAAHERETLEAVIKARADATKITIDPSNMDMPSLQLFQSAQGELSNALSRLLVVMESYPNLKASDNFQTLMVQLEGTENRISVERKRFNEAAQKYNVYIRTFPNTVFAALLGFEKKPYFNADHGAQSVPMVEF